VLKWRTLKPAWEDAASARRTDRNTRAARRMDRRPSPKRDVHGLRGGVRWSRVMRDAGAPAPGELAPGADAMPTPRPRRRERELMQAAGRLDSAIISRYLSCVKSRQRPATDIPWNRLRACA